MKNEMQWLHLSKDKPKESQWCIVWGPRGYDIAEWRRDERLVEKGYFAPTQDWRLWNLETSKYWMPLPKWPEIEKDNE